MHLPLSGIPIWYNRCERCGLLFTTAFDDWQVSDYQQAIYNQAYERVDPDYVSRRAEQNADMIASMLPGEREVRLMDHWYIAPRNGHITLHTRRSLVHLFAEHGYQVNHLSNSLHLAKRHHHE